MADMLAAMLTDPTTAAPSPALADVLARLAAIERWIAERNTDAFSGDTAPAIAPTTTAEDDFPARMQAARKAKGWTTRQLAAEAGVSQTVVSHVESRRTAGSPATRAKIAAALEMGGA
ncbi:MAG: helix-turn-helix transcriptional regulator [Magnetospirillum sp.]|nr:helix-turn-helix transcriptional regulator [Magnetospirillum sp.]